MELQWLDEQHAHVAGAEKVGITFSTLEDQTLIDTVLSMLLHDTFSYQE